MKYKRLTKQQLEELHQEFANFLATQSIDKKEWDEIKRNSPAVAEQELDVFSDLIWEGVLTNARYLEHYSKSYIFLFHCTEIHMQSIVIKSLLPEMDLLTKEGLTWLGDNLFTETVEVQTGKKVFAGTRNEDIFDLIKQGAILSNGQLYDQIFATLK